jgi:polar amino acid transport system substrate-binding protein
MIKGTLASLSSRRRFLAGGTVAAGAAVASAGLPSYRALAADSVDDSLLKKVLDRGKVVVGTGAGNPPWHFEGDDGQPVGMDIEMAKLLAAGLFGLSLADKATEKPRDNIEFVIQEANQRIPNLLTDKVDVNFQFMTVNTERATQVEFTIPYYREAVTILLLADSPYNTLADIQGKGLKVGVLQNTGADEMVHAGVLDAEIVQVPSPADIIAGIDSGRVDAGAVDLSTGQWYSAQSPDKYKYTPESWWPQTYSASVKPGDQIWLNYVNSVIHEAMTGVDFTVYQVNFKKYFNVDLPSPVAGYPAEYR